VSDAVSVRELEQMRGAATMHTLLDVRERPELEICQIRGTLNIAMGEIPARINELPKEWPLVVMCHHGVRSRMIVGLLRQAGFTNAVNLEGGIDAWARQIDTAMARY
jgi:rhodanese-related sulfurtransferase